MLRTFALTGTKRHNPNPNPHSTPIANPSFTYQTTRARAATLHLPHGPVPLPIFMPVATQASLKGLTPKQLEETGCRLCLNNTYHLYAGILQIASWMRGRENGIGHGRVLIYKGD